MNLTEPMCIIGASMGGTIVCMFAFKYPEYVSMICLLAPIGKIEHISEVYVTHYCNLRLR
jgi:alpha-beta hydrolase superfamily lysophospholipase